MHRDYSGILTQLQGALKMGVVINPLRGEDVRQKNEKLILQAIQQRKTISQSEIVALTGLKAPTVLRIFSYLEQQGLIEITEYVHPSSKERKGRKPVFYRVNPKAHYVIGVELWSKQVSIAVADFSKKLIYSKSIPVSIEHSEELYAMVHDLITEAVSSLSFDMTSVLGIGVGAPGRIKVKNGEIIYYSRVKDLENFPMARRLEEDFSVPVLVNNNASVVAMNVFRRESMDSSRTLLTILIRSGVGGAYICHGRLLTPQGRTAVELGHLSIDLHGRECDCGGKGCLEAYISEISLLDDAKQELGIDSLEELDSRIGEGQESALLFIQQRGEYLSCAARDLYHLFAPDTIMIITRYPQISRVYAEFAEDVLSRDSFCQKEEVVQVIPGVYDPVEACSGAADLVFDSYFLLQ